MSLNVILIDDHTLFREGLEGLLSRRNINVLAAIGDGQEGLRLAKELKPDVILLDMRMPDMDGMDVLRQLRQNGFSNPWSNRCAAAPRATCSRTWSRTNWCSPCVT
jgi:two-component system nitrate/nitrite response regulator NarL